MTTDTLADLSIAALEAEHAACLTMPSGLCQALGHHAAPRLLDITDCIDTIADPDLHEWHGWARSRILDVVGLAVQVERVAMLERRQS